MAHAFSSAARLRGGDAGRIIRPAAWGDVSPEAGPAVAVLISGCSDAGAAVRGYRTVLPRSRVLLSGDGLSVAGRVAAAEAGAEIRDVPPGPRDALVRRFFAEVEADIYIMAHGATGDDTCLAPLIVAEVDGGKDLVDVRRFADPHRPAPGERLLARAVDFAFGGGADILRSDFKACSRRFAATYRRTAPSGDDACARDLALHALRLRLPVGRVAALAAGTGAPAPVGSASGRAASARLVLRLLAEERPRRVFGLLGLALVGVGLAAAAPGLAVHRWHMMLLPGARTAAAAALLAAGGLAGAAGLLLDALASARQEVGRLGAAAIPRRADPAREAVEAEPVQGRHAAFG